MQKLIRGISTALTGRAGRPEFDEKGTARRIVKKRDGVDYLKDLVGQLRLKCVRMANVIETQEPCFYLRHDVDHDFDRGLDMAEAEHRHGYTATYFLLPPGSYGEKHNYYGTLRNGRVEHSPALVNQCKRLLQLGHDVGFHNDLVAMALTTRQDPRDMLAREIEFFARHSIPLIGTAAHGSALPVKLHFNNRELFVECERRKWEKGRTIRHNSWEVKLHSLSLKDFGFQFEAYSLPRDSRISDSGGQWAGRIAGVVIDQLRFGKSFDMSDFHRLFDPLQVPGSVKALSVLTHPCHWNLQ